ncbi:MAG TPA: class I SAM-dependent methyltransferase [Mycobacteriales bacterium]|nr:class I SAM-dependent methyltransferase [Mycobacteriales bacterium]
MASAEEVRASQRAAWDGLSAAWDKWERVILEQLQPVGTAMTDRLEPRDGHHVLDIASGTGEPGLSIARLVPNGRVVLTDLAPDMLDVAARRAKEHGLTNVETRVCSADDLPFEDASFDAVSVRFGFMFFPDLPAATDELVRVLKPGGRLCASVWVDPDRNPWTSIAMQAIGSEVPLPPADPDGPNMYRCAAPGQVSALYASAGLRDIAEWDIGVELVTQSADEYWQVLSEHVSLAAAALRKADDATRERIRDRAIRDVRPYTADGQVRVPGLARCIVGTKP